MFKMGSHCLFGHLKHKLWPKERWQFNSRPKKVKNRPDLLSCRQRAIYRWKALDESYNFFLDHTSIRGLLAKLWGSKVTGVPASAILGVPVGAISGLPCENPRREKPFGCGLREEVQSTIRGKVVASPKSGLW